jgi:hypothetical protein
MMIYKINQKLSTVSTGKVIHRHRFRKLSTDFKSYPQVIHRLSTGYPQSYPQAKSLSHITKSDLSTGKGFL